MELGVKISVGGITKGFYLVCFEGEGMIHKSKGERQWGRRNKMAAGGDGEKRVWRRLGLIEKGPPRNMKNKDLMIIVKLLNSSWLL